MGRALRYICKEIRLQAGEFQTVIFDEAELVGGEEGETYEGRADKADKLLPTHGFVIGKHYDFAFPPIVDGKPLAVEDYPPEEPQEE